MHNEKLSLYNNLFIDVPMACGILDAENLRIEQANDEILEIWGRDKSAVGYGLLDVMPELIGQHYPELIQQVLTTKVVHKQKAGKAVLMRNGKSETIFVDFCYKPILGQNDKAIALLITATDVTDRENDRLFRAESIRTLKAVITTAPVAMCYFQGEHHKVNTVNTHMLELWKKYEYMGVRELNYVFHTGLPYTHTVQGVIYSYTPVRDGLGGTMGIVLVANF
ncbi:PAS domain-containing protein [Pedobacter duraquae]|uniref:PAS domain-containing protein n=2 Tax=Pedobacter duraquae TaxID=425511 RepID=A0A4V3C2Z0_9SPHI|nr:PAS domain-containing protein [Pedobacter duraquae]